MNQESRAPATLKLCVLTCLLTCYLSVNSLLAESLFIENATIIQGDPAKPLMIENGSILIRDGIIVKIGSAEKTGKRDALIAPAGVKKIDAQGLIAIPAFIDSGTRAGLSQQSPNSKNELPQPNLKLGPNPHMRKAARNGLSPEVSAIDLFDPNDNSLQSYRQEGFGTLHLLPEGGYFSGQGAVVTLAKRNIREVALKENTGVTTAFSSNAGGPYPKALMGILAHMRQFVLDASHHSRWVEFHKKNPKGFQRPPRDTSLQALKPLFDGEIPLYFKADSDNDIHRALDFSKEFQLKMVLTGARDSGRVIERLGRENITVIYSPDFQAKPNFESKAGAHPPRVQLERLNNWQAQKDTPLKFHENNIRFTFATSGHRNPNRLMQYVHDWIEAGLPSKVALRALTLSAAELLGVEEVLGSIEEGKIASLAFIDAPFEQKDTRIKYLITDGELFEFNIPQRKKEEPKKDEEKKAEEKKKSEPPQAPKAHEDQVEECELDSDRVPSIKTNGDLYIHDATVITLAGPTLQRASIRIRNGKIEAVGHDVKADGIKNVIEANGWFVQPGIIDCHSHMATERGVNEWSDAITCEVRLDDVVDPHDITIYRALAGGVTAAHLLHGSANPIGGQCRLIKLKYGRPASELKVRDIPQTVKFALGENVKHSNFHTRRGERFPITRMGVEATFRRAFAAALDYQDRWNEYSKALARGKPALEPRRDLRLEALLKVLKGEILVHCHSYRADEILMLMRVASEFKFKIQNFQHVLEGYKVAPEMAAHGATASTFSDWWAYKFEVIDAIPYNGKIMYDSKVVVTFNSDDNELVRRLNTEAAKATKYGGISYEEALKFVTLNSAIQMVMQDRAGTIEVGKDADLAIYDSHPLSVYARCRYTIIEGEVYFERKDTQRKSHHTTPELGKPQNFLPDPTPINPQGLYAITNGTLHVPGGNVMEKGTLVVENGIIRAVGGKNEVKIPDGATVIDAKGSHIYPGLIDAGTRLGLVEVNSVRGSVDLGETGSAQPDLLMASAVNVHSELIPVARAAGITTTAIFNDFSGMIGGQAGVIYLAGRSNPEATIKDRLGLQVNIRGAQRSGAPPGWVKDLKDWWQRGKLYHEAKAKGQVSTRDERLEALKPYIDGTRPVIFSANGEAAIRLAINLTDEMKIKSIIRGGRDAWKVIKLLKEKKIPVIIGPVHSSPGQRHDPYDAPFVNASRLHAAGIPFAFQSNDEMNARNLPYQVGTAVAYGLPYKAAIHALTQGAADILGIGDQTGSLEVGKWADFFISQGDPLEVINHIEHLFIQGKPQSLETRHTKLYRLFKDRTTVPKKKTLDMKAF